MARKITDIINIKHLERENRKFLYIGFVIAVLFHGVLGLFITYERVVVKTDRYYHSVPVRLIERPPQLTEPFEIRKRAVTSKTMQPEKTEQRNIPGKIETHKPESPIRERDVDTGDMAYDSDLPVTVEDGRFVPDGFFLEDDGIERVPDRHILLKDEWITIDALDTGEYMALVIEDPGDRRNLKGFIHIPREIWGVQLRPFVNTSVAIKNLKDFVLKNYTGIEVKSDDAVYLDSPDIHNYPFLYITAEDPFELTKYEIENIRDYIRNGGFILMEPLGAPDPDDPCGMSRATASMRQMVIDIFGHQKLKFIPREHALFHCFFPIELVEGYNYYPTKDYNCWWKQPVEYIEGAVFENRLVLVYSEKGYSYGWGLEGAQTAYKFGVNCLVYALLQSAEQTRHLVDASSKTVQTSRQWWDFDLRFKYRSTEKSRFNPVNKRKLSE